MAFGTGGQLDGQIEEYKQAYMLPNPRDVQTIENT